MRAVNKNQSNYARSPRCEQLFVMIFPVTAGATAEPLHTLTRALLNETHNRHPELARENNA